MTAILYKIGIVLGVAAMFVTLLGTLPDASPLPSQVESFLDLVIPYMYYFNDILPVPTFFITSYTMLIAYFSYLSIKGTLRIVALVSKAL